MKVKDCMCTDVCYCTPDSKIQDVAKMMNSNHIGCIPICDNNNVVGLVTDRDIVLRCVACNKDPKQTPIYEIMTCNVCTCAPEDDMTNVETKMSQNQIRRLPVVEKGKVVGMLTLGDLANNVNELGEKQVFTTIKNVCECDEKKNAE